MRVLAGSCTQNSTPFHIFSFFMKTHNGVTAVEMAELLTHAAFYAGWPKAWAALRMAKEIYGTAD